MPFFVRRKDDERQNEETPLNDRIFNYDILRNLLFATQWTIFTFSLAARYSGATVAHWH